MARSVHTNQRAIDELERHEFSSAEVKAEMLADLRQKLEHKRLLKRFARADRRRVDEPERAGSIAALPVEIRDAGPHVFHAISAEDVRAVLALLPSNATRGLHEVRLELGLRDVLDYVADAGVESRHAPDPHTGRLGNELYPGVYQAPLRAWYVPGAARIHVLAYVVDEQRVRIDRDALDALLALEMLGFLVHEVAHHHDVVERTARGRWIADDETARELYAERRQAEWARDIVAPYLEHTRPTSTSRLLHVIAELGGLRLGLGDLVPPFPTEGDVELALCGVRLCVARAVTTWIAHLDPDDDPRHVRLDLARKLFDNGQATHSLEVVQALLDRFPNHAEARALRDRLRGPEVESRRRS